MMYKAPNIRQLKANIPDFVYYPNYEYQILRKGSKSLIGHILPIFILGIDKWGG